MYFFSYLYIDFDWKIKRKISYIYIIYIANINSKIKIIKEKCQSTISHIQVCDIILRYSPSDIALACLKHTIKELELKEIDIDIFINDQIGKENSLEIKDHLEEIENQINKPYYNEKTIEKLLTLYYDCSTLLLDPSIHRKMKEKEREEKTRKRKEKSQKIKDEQNRILGLNDYNCDENEDIDIFPNTKKFRPLFSP